jgi:uncharacterized pyridoxamine 5'-phosphate oxidase family protein
VELMEKVEFIEFLLKKRVVYFATVNSEGKPRVRKFSIINIENGKIYFFTADFKNVYKELHENNNVEFCISKKNDMIRVRGSVKFVESQEIFDKFLNNNKGIQKLYEGRIETLKLLYVEDCEVHIFQIPKVFEKTDFFAFKL